MPCRLLKEYTLQPLEHRPRLLDETPPQLSICGGARGCFLPSCGHLGVCGGWRQRRVCFVCVCAGGSGCSGRRRRRRLPAAGRGWFGRLRPRIHSRRGLARGGSCRSAPPLAPPLARGGGVCSWRGRRGVFPAAGRGWLRRLRSHFRLLRGIARGRSGGFTRGGSCSFTDGGSSGLLARSGGSGVALAVER